MPSGRQLITQLKQHVLNTMAEMPECDPTTGEGLGYRQIEELCELDLQLEKQNGWLTWSVVVALVQDGKLDLAPNTGRYRRFRLAS